MHSALSLLLKLRWRGHLRRLLRGAKSVRGVLLLAFTVVLFGAMIVPSIAMALADTEARRIHTDVVRELGPILLALYLLFSLFTSAGEKVICFSPAEIDLLFPSPFTRRQLLIYKLFGLLAGTVFVGLVFSFAILQHMHSWWLGYVGIVQTLLFLNLTSIVIAIIGQTVSEAAYTRVRRITLLVATTLLALGAFQAIERGIGHDLGEILPSIGQTRWGRVLLTPFAIYCFAVDAPRIYPEFIKWNSIGLGINVLLVIIIVRLDGYYIQSAYRISQKLHQRLERTRRRGSFAGAIDVKTARRRLRMLPWLGGCGPIAWRQLLSAIRQTKAGLFLILVILIAVGVPLSSNLREAGQSPWTLPSVVLGGLVYATIIGSQHLPLGFRADVDHLEVLKSLPIHPLAIACGQLSGPVFAISLFHLGLLSVMLVIATSATSIWVVAMLFAVPFNIVLLGAANLVFLWYPTRSSPGSAADFGRIVLLLMLHFGVTFLGLLPIALVAGGVLLITHSWFATLATAWCCVWLLGAAIVVLVADAFRRFDVSLNLPAS